MGKDTMDSLHPALRGEAQADLFYWRAGLVALASAGVLAAYSAFAGWRGRNWTLSGFAGMLALLVAYYSLSGYLTRRYWRGRASKLLTAGGERMRVWIERPEGSKKRIREMPCELRSETPGRSGEAKLLLRSPLDKELALRSLLPAEFGARIDRDTGALLVLLYEDGHAPAALWGFVNTPATKKKPGGQRLDFSR
jgi:hypothetical protein